MRVWRLRATTARLTVIVAASIGIANAFTTPRFNSEITLGDDKSVTVKDTVTVDFAEPGVGLTLELPNQNFKLISAERSLDGRDFQAVKANFSVSNGFWKCDVDRSSSKSLGILTYRVTYRSSPGQGLDPATGAFRWQLLPSNWPSAIENSEITIDTPGRRWITMGRFDDVVSGVHHQIAISDKIKASADNEKYSVRATGFRYWVINLVSPLASGSELSAIVYTDLGTQSTHPANPFDQDRAVSGPMVWTIILAPLILACGVLLWLRTSSKRT